MCSQQYPTLVFQKKWSNNRNSAYYRRDKLKTQILKLTASCYISLKIYLILADIHARTDQENQTPIHFASKYNATDALVMLIGLDARLDDRDHKERTPLQVAAETGIHTKKCVKKSLNKVFDAFSTNLETTQINLLYTPVYNLHLTIRRFYKI